MQRLKEIKLKGWLLNSVIFASISLEWRVLFSATYNLWKGIKKVQLNYLMFYDVMDDNKSDHVFLFCFQYPSRRKFSPVPGES